MFNIDFTIKNGWILSLAWIFFSFLPAFIGQKATKRLTNTSWLSKKGWIYSILIYILTMLLLAVPVFTSITNNILLLITGNGLLTIGGMGSTISFHNYFTTPTDRLITKGLYKLSRNPIYVSIGFTSAGITVLCSSYHGCCFNYLFSVTTPGYSQGRKILFRNLRKSL